MCRSGPLGDRESYTNGLEFFRYLFDMPSIQNAPFELCGMQCVADVLFFRQDVVL